MTPLTNDQIAHARHSTNRDERSVLIMGATYSIIVRKHLKSIAIDLPDDIHPVKVSIIYYQHVAKFPDHAVELYKADWGNGDPHARWSRVLPA